MILTNTKTGESWINVYPVFIAQKIGKHYNTIRNWRMSGINHISVNEWHIFFKPIEVKQDKGFARKY